MPIRQALILFILLCMSSAVRTQIAPDFSFTDTEGKTHNLYEKLRAGDTVVLDFFFADCKPCQKLTPQLVKLNTKWMSDTNKIIVWGISDRDNDSRLKEFDSTYSLNYSSVGREGGGDTVTALYSSWFTFFGWPTYAVICPGREIHWNIRHTDSLENIDSLTMVCSQTVSTRTPTEYPFILSPNPASNDILISPVKDLHSAKWRILDISGRIMRSGRIETGAVKIELNDLDAGVFIFNILHDQRSYDQKLIITK